MIITDKQKINEILTRGVEKVFVREHLEKTLLSGKPITVKLGFDPTGDGIHIGRAIVLWKLRAFQDLGHKIVFIVGDFTAQIGDPSDKLEKRPMLTIKEVARNVKNYKKLVGKIIDLKKVKFLYNSKWLSKLSLKETALLAESFSVRQMTTRRNFKERLDKGEEVSLREFLYPLMQGYDSVVVKADLEIGGFDQLFNLKAGRTIQRHYGQKEQDILITQMLEGTDGRKMSTSWGNVINIGDEPNKMFGKVMSIKDELIEKYFLLCTKASAMEVENVKKELESGVNPRDLKMKLAHEITALYHGEKLAEIARDSFVRVFREGDTPEDVVVVSLKDMDIAEALMKNKIIASKSELRRLISAGAVTHLEEKIKVTDIEYLKKHGGTYKIGSRRFVKILN